MSRVPVQSLVLGFLEVEKTNLPYEELFTKFFNDPKHSEVRENAFKFYFKKISPKVETVMKKVTPPKEEISKAKPKKESAKIIVNLDDLPMFDNPDLVEENQKAKYQWKDGHVDLVDIIAIERKFKGVALIKWSFESETGKVYETYVRKGKEGTDEGKWVTGTTRPPSVWKGINYANVKRTR